MTRFLLRIHRRVVLHWSSAWRTRWGERGFLVILAATIGALTALLANAAHWLVDKFEHVSMVLLTDPGVLFSREHLNWAMVLFFVLPGVGLLLSFCVQRWMGGPRYAKSLSPLILLLNKGRTKIPLSETVSHLLSSALSVGFGGSAGMEAPSVLAGAAVGSAGASFLGVESAKRPLLLGCGAAAAIAAIFDSPVAGVLFAAEVLLPEFSVSALVPMLISSAVATVISRLLSPSTAGFSALTEPWLTGAIPGYILLGVVCALIGVYTIRMAYFSSALLKSRLRSPWKRLLAGSAMLCVLLFLFPVLRGQGYSHIERLFVCDLDGLMLASNIFGGAPYLALATLFIAAILLKVVATALTVESGGDGGIFAPSMFIGAFTGFAFARFLNATGLVQLREFNFVAVGMCGVFTAVMRAPLTGIFLIAEVTGGYALLVPLMIVSAVSFFVARMLEPESIYRKALVDGRMLTADRDRNLLRRLPVRSNIITKYHELRPDVPLCRLTKLVQRGGAEELFPVIDGGRLVGVVRVDKILSVMLEPKMYELLLVIDLMEKPQGVISPDDDLARAMEMFEKYGDLEFLPVCDDLTGKFCGFVSKTHIFAQYRRLLREAGDF